MLVVFVCFKKWNSDDEVKEIVEFFLKSIIGYSGGMIIFRYFIMKQVDDYVSSSIGKVSTWISNYENYFINVYQDFNKIWILLVIFISLLFVYGIVKNAKKKKLFV